MAFQTKLLNGLQEFIKSVDDRINQFKSLITAQIVQLEANIQDQMNQFKSLITAQIVQLKAEIDDFIVRHRVPIGAVTMYMGKGTTPPTGWLFCDGTAIPSKYTALIKLIGANTPNMNNRFPMGTNTTSDVGKTVAAGLPNITGTFGGLNVWGVTGAFEETNNNGTDDPGNSGTCYSARKISFKASEGQTTTSGTIVSPNSSTIVYGKSNTVQPPAIKMRYIIRAE